MRSLLIFPAILVLTPGYDQSGNSNKREKTDPGNTLILTEKKDDVKFSDHIFDIKSAKIVFKYTGGPETGAETLYFDDYGNIAVLIVNKKTKFTKNNQTMIWKDKQTIMINHETKTVSKSPFRPKDTEPPGIAGITNDTRKSIGYEKLNDETIAGKTCEVWFNAKQNIKYWLWKKLDLKLENQGVYTKEATSVEEISGIPASLMVIPKDYKQ